MESEFSRSTESAEREWLTEITSCLPCRAFTTSAPIVPVAPTTRTFMCPSQITRSKRPFQKTIANIAQNVTALCCALQQSHFSRIPFLQSHFYQPLTIPLHLTS